jgi:energy-coupling factor transporter ATP-binding protein EcfA2
MFYYIYLFLLLIILTFTKSDNLKDKLIDKNLTVEINNENGSIIYKDLIEFINDGKLKMSNPGSKKQAIMVLGLTGVGKSTLVNYLNDIPLKCAKVNGVWRIDLENPNITLECGFKIGHKNSETIYPSACTPPGKLVSFIDNPGFQDNRGFEIEIANSFFREQIIENVEDLKFLILLNHGDVLDRRVQFFENIKRFSDFLGIFNNNDTNVLRKFSKSIGIIVSKVNNDGDSDLDVKHMLKELLSQSLKNNKILSPNETIVFKQVLENDQIEIFSNPRKNVVLDDSQKIQISHMIDRLDYIKKKDAIIRVSLDRSQMPKLNSYLIENFEKFEKNVEKVLTKNFHLFINNVIENPPNINNVSLIRKFLNQFNENSTKKVDFDIFMKTLDPAFLDLNSTNKVYEDKQVLDYFINLMPSEFRKSFSNERNWIGLNLVSKINDLVTNKLFKYILEENKKFQANFVSLLERNVENYAKISTSQAYDIDQIKKLQKFLENLDAQLKNEITEGFLMNLDSDLLSINEKSLQISQLKSLSLFNELLPIGMKPHISSRESLGALNLKLKALINELQGLQSFEEYNFGNNIFTYKANFAKMSSILSLINNAANIIDLKSVRIFVANSLVIDNFKIDTKRYFTHSPDVVIVSPQVKFNPKATIDLSCYTILGYPNNQVKAFNGNGFGANGEDGLAGLPGYNGGQLVVFADEILDSNNLEFKSKGSNGGPGQNGYLNSFITLNYFCF